MIYLEMKRTRNSFYQYINKTMLFPVLVMAFTITADARDYNREFGFSVGFSPGSTHGIGTVGGQQFVQAGFDFGFVLNCWEDTCLKYKVSLIPVAFVHGDQATLRFRHGRTVYGGGADPIGFQLNFRSHKQLQPFLTLAGGFLYFAEQVPVINSSQYNFTFGGGGGVEYMLGSHSILLGYRYHHISNARTGNVNPGIDSHILFLGFSFKR
jgi:opacity protein-like surface antigen